MDNKTYHDMTHLISASMLKTANKSMKHYWQEYVNPEREPKKPTRNMEIGTVFHTLLLEPENHKNVFTIVPEGIDKRTKDGKALFAEIEASGLIALKNDEFNDTVKMVESALNHPLASVFLDGSLPHTIESVHTWQADGIGFKMKTDYEIQPCARFPNGAIIDAKKAADAGEHGFIKSAFSYGYHIQAAHYALGFMDKYGTHDLPEVIFLAVESDAPYVCQWFQADDQFIEYGMSERERLIELITEARTTGTYKGYSDELTPLSLPGWVSRTLENEEIEGIEYV